VYRDDDVYLLEWRDRSGVVYGRVWYGADEREAFDAGHGWAFNGMPPPSRITLTGLAPVDTD
jgi:hypothetical protein